MRTMDEVISDLQQKTVAEDGTNPYDDMFNEIKTINETLSHGLETKDKEIEAMKAENTKLKDRVWQLYESQSKEQKPNARKETSKSAIEALFD